MVKMCIAHHDMYCNATAVLKIDSVYKQSENYHPQVYVEKCKNTDVGDRQCNMLSDDDDDDDDGYFEVQKETFVTCLRVTKLIINEQDVAVRACKKVEYTSSKLHENKGRA